MKRNAYTVSDANHMRQGVHKTGINGLYFIEHKIFPDKRGFFSEVARIPELNDITGVNFHPELGQINLAETVTNTIKGFHTENWQKLITVTNGHAFCAIADVNPKSETYKKVEIFELGSDTGTLKGSLLLAEGLGNSVLTLQGPVHYLYVTDKLYKDRNLQGDQAISLFDPDLDVEWPISKEDMIISDRDKSAVTLADLYG